MEPSPYLPCMGTESSFLPPLFGFLSEIPAISQEAADASQKIKHLLVSLTGRKQGDTPGGHC